MNIYTFECLCVPQKQSKSSGDVGDSTLVMTGGRQTVGLVNSRDSKAFRDTHRILTLGTHDQRPFVIMDDGWAPSVPKTNAPLFFPLHRLKPPDYTPTPNLQPPMAYTASTKSYPAVVILELRCALEDYTVARASAVLVINAADSRQGAASLKNNEQTTRKLTRRTRQSVRARVCVVHTRCLAHVLGIAEEANK